MRMTRPYDFRIQPRGKKIRQWRRPSSWHSDGNDIRGYKKWFPFLGLIGWRRWWKDFSDVEWDGNWFFDASKGDTCVV